MLIATPDEMLQKGLEMGGFNHRRQQRVKWDTCLWRFRTLLYIVLRRSVKTIH